MMVMLFDHGGVVNLTNRLTLPEVQVTDTGLIIIKATILNRFRDNSLKNVNRFHQIANFSLKQVNIILFIMLLFSLFGV